MDLAMGAMGSLLPKLGELLKDEYKMQTSVKRDVESFSRELGSMHAALGRVAEVPRDQLDGEVKLWACDVRELSYDMEDVVDSLLVRIKGSETGADMGVFKELMAKMADLFKMGKACRQIATAIKDIKEQLQDVATRHARYKAEGVSANLAAATRTAVDPLLLALYEDQQSIVGIGNARDEIIEKLRVDDDDVSQQPKILSIVGFGGLGKTTLAKAVYDKLKSGFDYAAFVPVSRNPDLKKVFKELLFEVDEEKFKRVGGGKLNEKQLIDELRESLGTKRYFIVIDDIRDINAWKTIQFAFMASKCRSRIITTTRNVSVSKECCSYNDDMVYKMKPLSDDDSQRLFYNRIFSRENTCPPELEQVSKDILKKCGGVPLAIITLASHLASNRQIKSKSQWYALLNSIGRGFTKGDTNLEEMKRILSFSFYDLPSHLKTCLLYLSVFPEDCYIRRDRLIGRWIVEGFIQGDNLFELGESYFNDLINRSMIQPMYVDVEGRAEGCCVHDMMLDLICDLSSEESFVTVLDVIKEDAPFERKLHRLSLQKSVAELTNTRLATTTMSSQVRSLTVFSPAINQMLPLSRFQVLRVLDLENCNLEGSCHSNLRCVGNLLHLRYLGLRNTRLREMGMEKEKLLMEIGKLLCLQVLDLDGVNTREFPASFVRLRNLICLYLPGYIELPVGLRNLTSLEELTGAAIFGNPDELCYLTKLRVLHFYWVGNDDDRDNCPIIVESLGKLRKLQSLRISTDYGSSFEPMRAWVPPPDIRRLELEYGWFETLPPWVSSSSLPLLSYLYIWVRKVELEDIQILGALPALCSVNVNSNTDTATIERASGSGFMLSADAFPCAREFHFLNVVLASRMFPAGAMPVVRTLSFSLRASDILSADFDLSIRNLPSLEQVGIRLLSEEVNSDRNCGEVINVNKDRDRYSEELRALKRAVDDHPNRRLKLYFCNYRGAVIATYELSPASSSLEVISS